MVGSVALVVVFVTRIPPDYFSAPGAPRAGSEGRHPTVALLLRLGRNALGAVLVAAGIAMLVLPGQGVLTILLGLMLVDFPGKRRVERALVARPNVFDALNWLRAKAGRPPLEPVGDSPLDEEGGRSE